MAIYSLSPMFQPQYAAGSAAALTFATPGAPSAVPAGFVYQLSVLRATNVTGSPVTLKIWRVPSGASDDAVHVVIPATVTIPVASQAAPHFDITALWGAVLQAGDAIWALAGSASAIVIQGDGLVVQP